jgi:hypothetical protein
MNASSEWSARSSNRFAESLWTREPIYIKVVKAIVEPGTTAVLTLTGNTKDDVFFSGTSTIRVVSAGK